jgi:hypothetical protein
MAETKLRADFDFAEYLAYAYDKTLKRLFETSIEVCVVMLVCMMLWILMIYELGPGAKVFCMMLHTNYSWAS